MESAVKKYPVWIMSKWSPFLKKPTFLTIDLKVDLKENIFLVHLVYCVEEGVQTAACERGGVKSLILVEF